MSPKERSMDLSHLNLSEWPSTAVSNKISMMDTAIRSTTNINTKPDQRTDRNPCKILRIRTRTSLRLLKNLMEGRTRRSRPSLNSRSGARSTTPVDSNDRLRMPSTTADAAKMVSTTFHRKSYRSMEKKNHPSAKRRRQSSTTNNVVQARSTRWSSIGTASLSPGRRIRTSAFTAMVQTLTTMLIITIVSKRRLWTNFSSQGHCFLCGWAQ
mmetsp:Transcript_10675/g.24321  ORF Transcript_10675/g.24321 Transcript_10675/m.24321 type:complete len:211 (+) Transcript_10675:806-1438(+)